MIPVNEPDLSGNEEKYLIEAIRTGWISSEGPMIKRFEQEFAKRVGRKFGVAVANGSVAIDAAITALDLGEGDEVILPSLTIISCAAPIVRAGAKPVPVDVDPITWNLDPEQVRRAITTRTRAIMPVHLYGLPCDMDPLLEIARTHDLKIVEDAAEVHGQTYRGKPCGSFGELSTFSFYPNKHVTTGEGGMVVMDDELLYERISKLRNLCFEPPRRFVHQELGWNFRMTNLQAALGVAQLERLDEFLVRKQAMGRRYRELLEGVKGLSFQPIETPYAKNHFWVFGVVLDDSVSMDADAMMKRLAQEGVMTRPFFWPMHEQPVFLKRGWYRDLKLPVSERLARRGLYLPSGLGLKPSQLEESARALKRVLGTL